VRVSRSDWAWCKKKNSFPDLNAVVGSLDLSSATEEETDKNRNKDSN